MEEIRGVFDILKDKFVFGFSETLSTEITNWNVGNKFP